MLDGNDPETFHNARQLTDALRARHKPVVVWIGAGFSSWLGYPLWDQFAEETATDFIRFEPGYDRSVGQVLLQSRSYPDFFDLVSTINAKRFRQKQIDVFAPRAITPIYQRALDLLRRIAPLRILTTNVDETLEKHLPDLLTIQRSNFELAPDLLRSNRPFICKLHGSIGSIDSTVFTRREYEALVKDPVYLPALGHILREAIIVFLGYSINDEYLVDRLRMVDVSTPLFGTGPHFGFVTAETKGLPSDIKPIRYISGSNGDRRGVLSAIDLLRGELSLDHSIEVVSSSRMASQALIAPSSGYYISDILAPGTWSTSFTAQISSGKDDERTLLLGQGFTNQEIPPDVILSLHDIIVGLICFDLIYFPLHSLNRVHQLLHGRLFDLTRSGIVRFIHWQNEPGIIFPDPKHLIGGDIGLLTRGTKSPEPISVPRVIREHLNAVPGREAHAENLFDLIEKNTSVFADPQAGHLIPRRTRGALMHPSVRALLGVSDAILPTAIPRWLAFPIIRLAHVIQVGAITEAFNLGASKIAWGAATLAASAFAVSGQNDWADSVASYVLAGRFNADLGRYVADHMELLDVILIYRDMPAGIKLREEVLAALAANAGPDLIASINAGLKANIPREILQQARDQLSGLFLRQTQSAAPAVWGNMGYNEDSIRLWRKSSAEQFLKVCREQKIGLSDPCPCGSTESVRLCCGHALEIHPSQFSK